MVICYGSAIKLIYIIPAKLKYLCLAHFCLFSFSHILSFKYLFSSPPMIISSLTQKTTSHLRFPLSFFLQKFLYSLKFLTSCPSLLALIILYVQDNHLCTCFFDYELAKRKDCGRFILCAIVQSTDFLRNIIYIIMFSQT